MSRDCPGNFSYCCRQEFVQQREYVRLMRILVDTDVLLRSAEPGHAHFHSVLTRSIFSEVTDTTWWMSEGFIPCGMHLWSSMQSAASRLMTRDWLLLPSVT
jgi:hypothetical protein